MRQIHSLNDATIILYDELELQQNGQATGTTTLSSPTAKFLSHGVKVGDLVFLLGQDAFEVTAPPVSETELILDRVMAAADDIVFSVARPVPLRKRAILAQNYSGVGDVILVSGSEFDGVLSGTYTAQIRETIFTYTSRQGNVLQDVQGLGPQSKGACAFQEYRKTELLFVQDLRVQKRPNRTLLPQFRTPAKRSVVLSTDITIEFSAWLNDLDFAKRITDANKNYVIWIEYDLADTIHEDAFVFLGCSVVNANVTNQDNANSNKELSYLATFGEITIKE